MARGRAVQRVADALRATVGIWALFEARNKLLGWPAALRWRLRERAELRRLRATVVVPPASVTTVVPTYRRPELVVAAVRSALAQDVADHTVIVVDDGAGLPPLPEDDRLVAVSLSSNTGVLGLVRNVGLGLARSPVAAFLDDDNTWHPHHLSTALAAIEAGAEGVYTAVERVHPDGTGLDVLSTPFDRRRLSDESFVDANSIVVRLGRGVRFSTLPRRRSTLPKEDWEFLWRFSRRRRVVHVPTVTVRYTVNPESYYTAWSTTVPVPTPTPTEGTQ